MEKIVEIANKLQPVLKDNQVTFAGVFGSYVKGRYRNDSDLDLLVEFSEPKSLLDIIDLENILSDKLNLKVDLLTEGAISPYIKPYIMKDLQIIYGERLG